MSNVKLSTEKLLAVVQLTAMGKATKKDQALAVGVSDDTIREWEYRSNAGDPAFIIPWLGREMQYAEALAIAQRFAYREMRARAERYVIHGRPRRTLAGGQFVIKLDRKALAITDPDIRELLGYHREAYDLDADGAVQWVEEVETAPAGLVEIFLRTFPDLQTTTNTNLNVKGGLSLGVQVAPKVDYRRDAPPIPPPPPMPALEVLPDPALADGDDLADLLGPDPGPGDVTDTEPNEYEEPELEPAATLPDAEGTTGEPEPVMIRDLPSEREKIAPATPKPRGFDEVPERQPRNDLERDLFAKLRAAREKPKP
jgi:hypothetical protein